MKNVFNIAAACVGLSSALCTYAVVGFGMPASTLLWLIPAYSVGILAMVGLAAGTLVLFNNLGTSSSTNNNAEITPKKTYRLQTV